MITIAGNPVLSAPDGDRLDRALDGVGFMLSIDPYLNETTRHADVILPPPPPSQSAHFDFAFSDLAVRNNARYSRRCCRSTGGPTKRRSCPGSPSILSVSAPTGTPPRRRSGHRDDVDQGDRRPELTVAGRAVDELTAMLAAGPGYERRLDMMLRLGAYGDAFGAKPDGLTLERLKAAPHGIDLGPLQPRLPEVLRTPTGEVELAPEPLVADVARLRDGLGRRTDGFVLIGRRHLRSNNSWMHNVPALAGGTNLCTLRIHPDDAAELGLTDTAASRAPAVNYWRRSRSPTACGAAWSPCRTDGVTTRRHGTGARGRSARCQRQPAQRRGSARPAVGHRVLNGIPVDIAPAG